jgi:phosphate butyryltransferase
MELKNLDTFIEIAKSKPGKIIAVAAAEDDNVLSAVSEAKKRGIASAILVGNKEKIIKIAGEENFDISDLDIIEENVPALAARKAVSLIREGTAHILMKGMVGTADFLRAVLNKEEGLREGALLSHIGFFEIEAYHKVIALTDAAQNIAPDLKEKTDIIKNAVKAFHRFGVANPKIGLLAPVELVNPKMESTIDAALLTMMNRRGQIKGAVIDGPLAFDNIVSKEAAEHKGLVSEVAGDADLIVAPNIETANAIYKSFTYFGKATVAAIILGAAAPIVLTSRADSDRSKLMSVALAASY